MVELQAGMVCEVLAESDGWGTRTAATPAETAISDASNNMDFRSTCLLNGSGRHLYFDANTVELESRNGG